MEAAALAQLPDDQLLEVVQRQTFKFFWDGGHPVSGLTPDRCTTRADASDDKSAIGGSGFGMMAIIVAAERGWVTREAAVDREAVTELELDLEVELHFIYACNSECGQVHRPLGTWLNHRCCIYKVTSWQCIILTPVCLALESSLDERQPYIQHFTEQVPHRCNQCKAL